MSKQTPISRYPYIRAWGIDMGSFDYYIKDRSAEAAEDGAPDDVIYRQDFDKISKAERESALDREQQGTAFMVRNEDGTPRRVWFRVNGILPGEVRARLDKMADNIRAGRPARG